MNHRALGVVALLTCASACASPVRQAAPPRAVTHVAHPSSEPPPSTGALWERIAPRDVPLPVQDIAALSGNDAIAVAAGGLFFVGSGAPHGVCDAERPAASIIQADGDRFIALGGTDAEPFAWRSSDRGLHCARVRLPSLSVRFVPSSGALQLSLDGEVAVAWTLAGGIAYSGDAGASWRRITDLPGVTDLFPRPDGSLVAAARMLTVHDPVRSGEALRLYRLAHATDAFWEPLVAIPERHHPLQAVRDASGDLLLLDAYGTVGLGQDGHLHDDHPEPAMRSPEERIRVAVPAGAGQFVVATERTMVAVTSGTFEPFAAFEATPSLAIDANAEGVVWFTRHGAIYRGRIGRNGLDPITSAPQFAGPPAQIAASGASIAIVSTAGDAAVTSNGGRTWHTLRLDVADADGAVFDQRGNLLVIGGRPGEPAVLAVTDGQAAASMTPRERAGATSRERIAGDLSVIPAVGTVGERWVVVDGAVFTSDDEGANWSAHPMPGDPSLILAAALHGAGLLVLDVDGRLWRSDDAGASFRLLGAPSPLRQIVAFGAPVRIAWDGANEITLVSRDQMRRSIDGGATWVSPVTTTPGMYGGEVFCLPDGRLLRLIGTAQTSEMLMFMLEDGTAYRLAPAADTAFRVAALAIEGTWLYLATPEGSLLRADTRRLQPAVDTRPPVDIRLRSPL